MPSIRWPWSRERAGNVADADFTRTITQLLQWAAADVGHDADARRASAIQHAANLYGRALSTATVTGARPALQAALTPGALGQFGRDSVLYGESARIVDVAGDALMLRQAVISEAHGTALEPTFTLRLYGPDTSTELDHLPRASSCT